MSICMMKKKKTYLYPNIQKCISQTTHTQNLAKYFQKVFHIYKYKIISKKYLKYISIFQKWFQIQNNFILKSFFHFYNCLIVYQILAFKKKYLKYSIRSLPTPTHTHIWKLFSVCEENVMCLFNVCMWAERAHCVCRNGENSIVVAARAACGRRFSFVQCA